MKLSDSRGLSLLLVGLLTLLSLQRLSAQTGQTTQADKDKSFSLNVDGRLTFDAATYFIPGSSDLRYSGAPFRMSPASQVSQARIAAVVGLDRWSGRFDLDFVRARVTLCDLFVRYSYAPQANITVGYIFDPISIGINTATRHRSVNLAPAVAPPSTELTPLVHPLASMGAQLLALCSPRRWRHREHQCQSQPLQRGLRHLGTRRLAP